MNEKKKSSKGAVFGLLLLAGFIIFYVASAVINLVKLGGAKELSSDEIPVEGDFVSCSYPYGTDCVLTMKHSINYLIPTGKEYYYILMNDDYAVFVRAGKELKKNSDGEYEISGKVRKMDRKVQDGIMDRYNYLKGEGIKVPATTNGIVFIDGVTKLQSVLRLISAIAALAGVLLLLSVAKHKVTSPVEVQSKAPAVIAAFLLVASVIIMIYTLSFM